MRTTADSVKGRGARGRALAIPSSRPPRSPMRRMNLNVPLGNCVEPFADDETTRKDEYVDIAPVDHGEFKVAVERSGANWLPHAVLSQRLMLALSCRSCLQAKLVAT